MSRRALLGFAPALLVASSLLAVDGNTDDTFQSSGRWVYDVPSFGARGVGVAPDGRLVVGYTYLTGNGEDKDFQTWLVPDSGDDELCATWFPDFGGTNDDRLEDLVVSGNHLIVAGSAAGPAAEPALRLAVARFDLDNFCQLDPDFGGGDGYFLDPSYRIEAKSVAVDFFGQVVLAAEQGDGAVDALRGIRLDASGVLQDQLVVSFLTAFGAENFEPYAITVRPDGRRIVAGTMRFANGDYDVGVAVFTPQGELDSSFSIDGLAGFSYDVIDSGFDGAFAVAALADGRIVVAGSVQHGASFDAAFAILTATGGYDNGFGFVGRYSLEFGAGDRTDVIRALAVQGDHKIVGAGYTAPPFPGTDVDFAIARLHTSGDLPLDETFGTGGKRVPVFDEGGTNADHGYDLTLGQGGRITVVGSVAFATNTGVGVIRLENSYIFADGFEWGQLYGTEWKLPPVVK